MDVNLEGKIQCLGQGCKEMATWFLKRRKDVPQVGSGEVLYFCSGCFKKFGEKVFPQTLYYRYYNPHGIKKEVFAKLDFERIINEIEEGGRKSNSNPGS